MKNFNLILFKKVLLYLEEIKSMLCIYSALPDGRRTKSIYDPSTYR